MFAARLYAAMTGRHFEGPLPSSSQPVPSAPGSTIIVGLLDDLTCALLERIIDGPGCSAGLICAPTLDHLISIIPVRAAAVLSMRPSEHPVCIDVLPSLQCMCAQAGDRLVLGADCPDDILRSALNSGADILRISSHADGVDMWLPNQHIMCAIEENLSGPGMPTCIATQYCHRIDRPVSEIHSSARAVRVFEIAARVAMLDVCRGLIPAESIVSPQWGLLRRFIESPRIACILVTADYGFRPDGAVEPFISSLCLGESIGSALHTYVCSEDGQRAGRRFFIFGDPLLTVANSPANWGKLTSAHDLLPSELTIRECLLTALTALRNLPHTAETLSSIAKTLAPLGWARLMNADVSCHSSWTWSSSQAICDSCGLGMRHLALEATNSDCPRVIKTCQLCGPVADVPTDAVHTSFRWMSDNRMCLYNFRPSQWAGFAVVWTYNQADIVLEPWPSTENGEPAQTFALPRIMSTRALGPQRLGCLMVTPKSWYMWCQPANLGAQS